LIVAKTSALPGWQLALLILTGTVVGVVAVTCLYWARTVFIPVALAVFLAFLLAPLVAALQRRGLRRLPSVIFVVTLAAAVLGGVVWLVTAEVASLAAEVPEYTDNIKVKVKSLRHLGQGSVTGRLEKMVQEITGEWNLPAASQEGKEGDPPTVAAAEQPTAVVLQSESPSWLARMPALLNSLLETLGGLALALVLVVFMLLKREDLRNRLIRLVSHGQITVMTKALDDAGQRISRFLLMQLVVNSAVGVAVGLGLLAFGIEYAFLWGFLAAVFRYVPYIGIWIAAVPPTILSLAMFAGWLHPLLLVGLFLAIELIAANVVEPRLYGRSIGVSEVALLVAAALWAFLWGPIGLVLSSPLTVCLVVLGKYVPQLKFLDVLLGDEPPLDAHVTFYQRLLARDQDEAAQLVLAQVKVSSPEQVYDDFLVPALNFARRDRERDDLTESDELFVLQATREILEDLGERREAATQAEDAIHMEDRGPAPAPIRLRVLACPAHDQADRLALEMLRQLLDPAKWIVEVAGVEMLTADLLAHVAEQSPALVCIGALPPGGLAHTRYLCKKLRARFPEVKIVVGRWGLTGNVEADREQLQDAGADLTATTMLETRCQLSSLLPILTQEQGRPQAGGGDPAATGVEGGVAEDDSDPEQGVVQGASQGGDKYAALATA
jgi:predicted PurR-regulated permease PerM